VWLHSSHGNLGLDRPDGRVATFTIPGEADRPVALQRRGTAELLAEELRRLDNDDVYQETVLAYGRSRADARTPTTASGRTKPAATKTAAKKTAAKRTTTRKAAKKTAAKKAADKTGATRTAPARSAAKRASGRKTAPSRRRKSS
jgi:hypothetical protein